MRDAAERSIRIPHPTSPSSSSENDAAHVHHVYSPCVIAVLGFEMVRVVSVLGLVMFSVALLILSLISYVSIKKDFIFTAPKYANAGGPRMYMFHAGFRYVHVYFFVVYAFISHVIVWGARFIPHVSTCEHSSRLISVCCHCIMFCVSDVLWFLERPVVMMRSAHAQISRE